MSRVQKGKYNRHLLRVLSLVVGIFLWRYVLNTTPIEEEKKIKLVYKIPEKLAILEEIPSFAYIKLVGPRGIINGIDESKREILVDLNRFENFPKGQLEVDLKSLPLQVPLGIEVSSITPSKLLLTLEPKKLKTVPIKIATVGTMDERLELKKLKFSPANIKVWGGESLIDQVTFLETESLDLEKIKSYQPEQLGAWKIQKSGLNIERELETGVLSFDLTATEANITIDQHPITYISTSVISKMSHRQVKIELSAIDEKAFKASDVKIVAEVPTGKSGNVRVELAAKLPSGVSLVKMEPAQVDLVVEK